MRARARSIRARQSGRPGSAIVVRPGGFTIGRHTLAFELLELAGLENDIADLDRWGSLSIEALLTSRPEYLVITRYRSDEASLANSFLTHPALVSLARTQKTLQVDARYFACGAPASLTAAESLLEQMAAP
jgi:iron complex transport system substrate-binding protein